MKKLLSVLLLFAILISVPSFAPAAEASSTIYYTTSTGITFSLDEVVIYWSDLEEFDFYTSQAIIDSIYRLGMNRPSIASDRFEVFDIPLTVSEIQHIIEYSILGYNCLDLLDIRSEAISKAAELYPTNHSDGDLGNAFQHAYWVILIYYQFLPSAAIDFPVAHEEYDSNPILHKTMDLFNDYVAYDYCESLNNYGDSISETTMVEYASYLVSSGQLDYIIEDYRYVYKITTYLDTGRTLVQYRIGDYYAKTNSTEPYNVPGTIIEEIPEDPMTQINGILDDAIIE